MRPISLTALVLLFPSIIILTGAATPAKSQERVPGLFYEGNRYFHANNRCGCMGESGFLVYNDINGEWQRGGCIGYSVYKTLPKDTLVDTGSYVCNDAFIGPDVSINQSIVSGNIKVSNSYLSNSQVYVDLENSNSQVTISESKLSEATILADPETNIILQHTKLEKSELSKSENYQGDRWDPYVINDKLDDLDPYFTARFTYLAKFTDLSNKNWHGVSLWNEIKLDHITHMPMPYPSNDMERNTYIRKHVRFGIFGEVPTPPGVVHATSEYRQSPCEIKLFYDETDKFSPVDDSKPAIEFDGALFHLNIGKGRWSEQRLRTNFQDFDIDSLGLRQFTLRPNQMNPQGQTIYTEAEFSRSVPVTVKRNQVLLDRYKRIIDWENEQAKKAGDTDFISAFSLLFTRMMYQSGENIENVQIYFPARNNEQGRIVGNAIATMINACQQIENRP